MLLLKVTALCEINKPIKLYFALVYISLYYSGYFVGVINFVYISVH